MRPVWPLNIAQGLVHTVPWTAGGASKLDWIGNRGINTIITISIMIQNVCGQRAHVIRYADWITLPWRHNGRGCVSNHRPHDCLFNRLFRRRSKKTSKLRVTGLCAGNSQGTGEFPAQMASNAENFPFDDGIMKTEVKVQCVRMYSRQRASAILKTMHMAPTLVCLRCDGPDVLRCQWSGSGWLNDRFWPFVSAFSCEHCVLVPPELEYWEKWSCDDNKSKSKQ